MVYLIIIKAGPDLGDLLIVMRNFDQPVSTFTCPKSWVSGLELTDSEAFQQLVIKVLMTSKNA